MYQLFQMFNINLAESWSDNFYDTCQVIKLAISFTYILYLQELLQLGLHILSLMMAIDVRMQKGFNKALSTLNQGYNKNKANFCIIIIKNL